MIRAGALRKTKTSKTANKRAIKALPALRASLIWFKRKTVRELKRRAEEVASPRRQVMLAKAREVAATDLADLRHAYQCDRVSEIATARRFELSRAVPGIVWLSAPVDLRIDRVTASAEARS